MEPNQPAAAAKQPSLQHSAFECRQCHLKFPTDRHLDNHKKNVRRVSIWTNFFSIVQFCPATTNSEASVKVPVVRVKKNTFRFLAVWFRDIKKSVTMALTHSMLVTEPSIIRLWTIAEFEFYQVRTSTPLWNKLQSDMHSGKKAFIFVSWFAYSPWPPARRNWCKKNEK